MKREHTVFAPYGSSTEHVSTIDEAIVRAEALSRAEGGRILVRDPQGVIRGFAQGGTWRWGRACRDCAGSGRIPRVLQPSQAHVEVVCARCLGYGAEADPC